MPNETQVIEKEQSANIANRSGSDIQASERTRNIPQAVDAGQLLQIAVESGADLDKLEKLMELQERHERRDAEKQFNYAISDFQKEVPRIVKRKEGHGYNYAPLGDIVEQIKATAAKFGLSWKWTNEFLADGMVNVTCHVRHVAGHVEPTTVNMFIEQPNKMQSRNQMIGVAVTYGQRYSIIGALGLSTADDDIDGRVAQEFKNLPPYTQFRNDQHNIRDSLKRGFTAESVIEQLSQSHKVSDTVKSKIYLMEKEIEESKKSKDSDDKAKQTDGAK